MDGNEPPGLKVDSHVLVQLGSELVTDAEQAILECVKNAYDADSTGCRIVIETDASGTLEDFAEASRLRDFAASIDSVKAELLAMDGSILPEGAPGVADDERIRRRLSWKGRIAIIDTGTGMDEEALRESWLVVSRSNKRVESGRKTETSSERIPLGDKGLGRLGTMKLGDILSVESAPSSTSRLASARFRWADCATAPTIDRIPVTTTTIENAEGFKGTKVSILGLRDLPEWRRKGRINEIAARLTRLISPFETKTRFRVGLSYDGVEHSLAAVTEEVLARCVARFDFEWGGKKVDAIEATARFRRRLFTPTRTGKAKDKAEKAFIPDQGRGFYASLHSQKRLKAYVIPADPPDGEWFVELKADIPRSAFMPAEGEATDPGPFKGSFYYFHLDSLDDDPTASLQAINGRVIKDMAGISILRDGFRVRSHGDWLELAAGMTSGSTYQLRVNNTVGFFALTGRDNHALVEKSDREGFVENAAYRGFFAIARACRKFANDSLEDVRRAFDAHADGVSEREGVPKTAQASLALVERQSRQALKARADAVTAADVVRGEMETLELRAAVGDMPADETIGFVRKVVSRLEDIARGFEPGPPSTSAVERIRQVLDDNKEQAAALLESAAIGLSARGMAHELRTHLTEIRRRTTLLEAIAKGGAQTSLVSSHVRAIKGACSEIQKAAALIDPMLPRTRATKETFPLLQFAAAYLEGRSTSFERNGIDVRIVKDGEPGQVHTVRPRLLQALDNLVRNAAYWVQRDDPGRLGGRWIEIAVARGSISVSDSGPGVDGRYEESLFEMFVTGRPEDGGGQGLGLYITRNLLESMGCAIDLLPIRNDRGGRCTFLMDLRAITAGTAP